jgi:hypothetical protein
VDESISGTVTGVTVPVRSATVTDASGRRRYDLSGGLELGAGSHLLECRLADDRHRVGTTADSGESGIVLYLRFDGPASVDGDGSTVSVSFPGPSPVTFGFTERRDDPATVTVPGTPEGVATAITSLGASLRTTDPARSHPSVRDHPPLVEVGETESIPDAVTEAVPETGIELQLPASLEYLFVGAPLAYYLGATVTVSDRSVPRLVAPEADVEYRFRTLPTFQHGVTRLLRQVFFFDSLVRDVDAEQSSHQRALAERFDLDPERARSLSPAERLARYFWVPQTELADHLPEWHFSTYAAPERGNVESLPYLLDSLALIYLPEASELRGTELLERTLDDCYRFRSVSDTQVASVDMVKPELQAGRVHAWLAPGAPIDAFKTSTTAFENRRRYHAHGGSGLSVTVVLNDDAMADEHDAVADIYRERSADLPMSVTVREHLSRSELADVFASPNDFVHYIGHCDADGLQCADGSFSASSLSTCQARTFFLNACGSYHEGLELVEQGSVAGAVTLTKVLDRQAAKVGTAFARLLVHGFGLEPAMQLSRRRIMMGKDYAVVGDGTYTLAPRPESPTVGWLSREGDRFRLTCEAMSARTNGDCYHPPFADQSYLHGSTSEALLDRDELVQVLGERPLPVVFENEFHWSEELAATLSADGR